MFHRQASFSLLSRLLEHCYHLSVVCQFCRIQTVASFLCQHIIYIHLCITNHYNNYYNKSDSRYIHNKKDNIQIKSKTTNY